MGISLHNGASHQGDKHSDIIDEHKRDAEGKLAYSHFIYRGCNL